MPVCVVQYARVVLVCIAGLCCSAWRWRVPDEHLRCLGLLDRRNALCIGALLDRDAAIGNQDSNHVLSRRRHLKRHVGYIKSTARPPLCYIYASYRQRLGYVCRLYLDYIYRLYLGYIKVHLGCILTVSTEALTDLTLASDDGGFIEHGLGPPLVLLQQQLALVLGEINRARERDLLAEHLLADLCKDTCDLHGP